MQPRPPSPCTAAVQPHGGRRCRSHVTQWGSSKEEPAGREAQSPAVQPLRRPEAALLSTDFCSHASSSRAGQAPLPWRVERAHLVQVRHPCTLVSPDAEACCCAVLSPASPPCSGQTRGGVRGALGTSQELCKAWLSSKPRPGFRHPVPACRGDLGLHPLVQMSPFLWQSLGRAAAESQKAEAIWKVTAGCSRRRRGLG